MAPVFSTCIVCYVCLLYNAVRAVYDVVLYRGSGFPFRGALHVRLVETQKFCPGGEVSTKIWVYFPVGVRAQGNPN